MIFNGFQDAIKLSLLCFDSVHSDKHRWNVMDDGIFVHSEMIDLHLIFYPVLRRCIQSLERSARFAVYFSSARAVFYVIMQLDLLRRTVSAVLSRSRKDQCQCSIDLTSVLAYYSSFHVNFCYSLSLAQSFLPYRIRFHAMRDAVRDRRVQHHGARAKNPIVPLLSLIKSSARLGSSTSSLFAIENEAITRDDYGPFRLHA